MTQRLAEYCIILIMSLSSAQASLTALCSTGDSYWEVREGKQDNTFACTGLSAQDTVAWQFWESTSVSFPIGSCPPRPANGGDFVCTQLAYPVFRPSRISDDTTVMVINVTAASDAEREHLGKGQLLCQAPVPQPQPPTAGCRLDYIYAGEDVSCTVHFRQDTWTVSGQCNITKTRSVQNRYRCEWIQTKQSPREAILIANTSMSVVLFAGTNYVSGWCNVTSILPPEGKYTYRVIVAPGEVTVNASFIGSNEIRHPSATPHHNCPQYVVEGGDLNCTCFVSDLGSPPGVLQWNTTQSTQLGLSVTQALNSGIHVCQLLWNNTLAQSVKYTSQLASPPSVPVIYPTTDTTVVVTYPFMEGESGTLHCQSNQTGRPEATYTWPIAASGHVSGSNLTFYQLTREDNGRLVKCRASNVYTENKQPVDDAAFVLQVYYNPVLNFTSVSDANDCSLPIASSAYTQCVVAQGRRVHINCTADSNPPPASFKWLGKNTDVFSNTSELVITSADQAIHDGDYSCTVLTMHDNTDSRLPLTASSTFTVVVGYSPSVLDFSVNSPDNMTLHTEHTHVELRCVASGRPTPSIRLINASNPSQFLNQSEPKSDLHVGRRTEEVSFSIDRVQCEASGVYRCEANNALGQDTQTEGLLVYCAPRGKNTDETIPTVSATGGKGQLSFTMTAYPKPVVKSMSYLNPSQGETSVTGNNIKAACFASYVAPAAVTCNISVMDMKPTDRGFYRIVFSNSLGEMAFIFFVEEDDQEEEADSKIAVIAVLAVILTLVIVVNVVAVVWMWRRGWSLPCTGTENQRGMHHNNPRGDTSRQHLTTANRKISSAGSDRDVGPYDGLRLEDVGIRSPYEEILQEQSSSDTPHYEVLMHNRTHESRAEESKYANQ